MRRAIDRMSMSTIAVCAGVIAIASIVLGAEVFADASQ
jgi:hypothetical protein